MSSRKHKYQGVRLVGSLPALIVGELYKQYSELPSDALVGAIRMAEVLYEELESLGEGSIRPDEMKALVEAASLAIYEKKMASGGKRSERETHNEIVEMARTWVCERSVD